MEGYLHQLKIPLMHALTLQHTVCQLAASGASPTPLDMVQGWERLPRSVASSKCIN